MIKAFIIDDELPAIELIKKYISRIDFIELYGYTSNSLKAFSFLQKNNLDVVFMDINMPSLSGLELYKALSHKPKIIFTTAHPEYAVEGYELDALDYLLKPISFTRFLKSCEKIHRNLPINQEAQTFDSILSDTVYIKSGTETHRISWKDVLYLEKDENYVIYHLKGEKILCRTSLSRTELMFPSYIVRIHQSYAVSLLHAKILNLHRVQINNKSFSVGRKFKETLKEKINTLP